MSTPARIVHLIGTNFFGGPERQILAHARLIRARGLLPSILSFSENGRSNELLQRAMNEGIPCHELSPRSPFHPGAVTELAGILRRDGADLLVAHGYKANVVGRLASWAAGIPLLAVSRGWTAENFRIRIYEKADRLFLRLANHVVAVSEGQRRKIAAAGVAESRVTVIRNCIDLDEFPKACETDLRQQLGLAPDVLLVVSAGRLSPEKNHRGLIEAAAQVCAKEPKAVFVVFGEGFLRTELEKSVADHGLTDRFLFPGFRSDVRALLHHIDIFVLPSFTEGLPNVILEAFACRKPVVATAVGGTPEVVRHEEDGLLVEPGDGKALAGAILRLAASSEARRDMGERGRDALASRFAFPAQTEAYVRLYSRLLAKGDL